MHVWSSRALKASLGIIHAIKGAIQNEIMTSIELVFVDRSEYFPAGPIGYLFEPDIHFYLSYQKQLLVNNQ